MEKLQLKHIAPYLPYGLKAQCKNLGILEITDMSTKNDNPAWAYTKGDYEHKDFNYDVLTRNSCTGHGFYLSDIKLLLRPLSDLVKPLPSGEIPMIQLAKIEGLTDMPDDHPLFRFQILDGVPTVGVRFNIENDDDDDTHVVFGYDTINGFGKHFRPSKDWSIVGNQVKLFEYLFANHFDVFGLIEKGLAIDINEIND